MAECLGLLSLLKTIGLFENLISKVFKADNNEVVHSSDKANKIVVNLSKNKKSRNLMHMLNIGAIGECNFLTSDAKKVFNYL